jgi:DHA1 family tetracycline resistance protein-like MFS transporter
MSDSPTPAPTTTASRSAVSFILVTSFLNLAGIGLIGPVLPPTVARYVPAEQVDFFVAVLLGAYSFFQFLFVPLLGALSDRYGRRPVLLFSLLGSALGYVLLGVGGALWVLFAGRIIDGITGGNLAAIYAYGADITTPRDRTRFFGLLGAA